MLERQLSLPCGLTLKNRIVKSAMTERLARPSGAPSPQLLELFRRFAQGGAGMLLTGNVVVDGHHLEAFGNVTFDRAESDVELWRSWAAIGRDFDAPIIVQLNHPGRQAMRSVTRMPVAPSAVGLPNKKYFATPHPLEEFEILHIIDQFVRASVMVEKAGFAGVEIHAAHGYLLSQFLSPNVNRRDDQWGGSLENRSRLLTSIVKRVREAVSPKFAVGVKLNAGDFVVGGLDPEDARHVIATLDGLGVDFIEISGGTFERPASFGAGLPASTLKREGYFLELARQARMTTALPLIVTGGFRSGAAMTDAISSGACDLIGLARPLAIEPAFPARLLADPSSVATKPAVKLPAGPIAALAELSWHREQLERIGSGRTPRTGGSGMASVLRMTLRDKWKRWQRRRFVSALHVQTATSR